MRLPWPFGRRTPSDGPSPAAPEGATPSASSTPTTTPPPTGAWTSLPPIQRTVGDAPLVAPSAPFLDEVPGHRPLPPIVQALGHETGPSAPPGLVLAKSTAVPSLTSGAPMPVQRRTAAASPAAPETWSEPEPVAEARRAGAPPADRDARGDRRAAPATADPGTGGHDAGGAAVERARSAYRLAGGHVALAGRSRNRACPLPSRPLAGRVRVAPAAGRSTPRPGPRHPAWGRRWRRSPRRPPPLRRPRRRGTPSAPPGPGASTPGPGASASPASPLDGGARRSAPRRSRGSHDHGPGDLGQPATCDVPAAGPARDALSGGRVPGCGAPSVRAVASGAAAAEAPAPRPLPVLPVSRRASAPAAASDVRRDPATSSPTTVAARAERLRAQPRTRSDRGVEVPTGSPSPSPLQRSVRPTLGARPLRPSVAVQREASRWPGRRRRRDHDALTCRGPLAVAGGSPGHRRRPAAGVARGGRRPAPATGITGCLPCSGIRGGSSRHARDRVPVARHRGSDERGMPATAARPGPRRCSGRQLRSCARRPGRPRARPPSHRSTWLAPPRRRPPRHPACVILAGGSGAAARRCARLGPRGRRGADHAARPLRRARYLRHARDPAHRRVRSDAPGGASGGHPVRQGAR